MKKYIGTKHILAKPMNRQEYNDYREWELPSDEDGKDEGYLVEYLDSPNSNHPNHKCYISWSPKDVFERAYHIAESPLDRMIIEERELNEKIFSLAVAIGSDGFCDKVGAYQFELLCAQHSTMIAYRRILNLRITDLKSIKHGK